MGSRSGQGCDQASRFSQNYLCPCRKPGGYCKRNDPVVEECVKCDLAKRRRAHLRLELLLSPPTEYVLSGCPSESTAVEQRRIWVGEKRTD